MILVTTSLSSRKERTVSYSMTLLSFYRHAIRYSYYTFVVSKALHPTRRLSAIVSEILFPSGTFFTKLFISNGQRDYFSVTYHPTWHSSLPTHVFCLPNIYGNDEKEGRPREMDISMSLWAPWHFSIIQVWDSARKSLVFGWTSNLAGWTVCFRVRQRKLWY